MPPSRSKKDWNPAFLFPFSVLEGWVGVSEGDHLKISRRGKKTLNSSMNFGMRVGVWGGGGGVGGSVGGGDSTSGAAGKQEDRNMAGEGRRKEEMLLDWERLGGRRGGPGTRGVGKESSYLVVSLEAAQGKTRESRPPVAA